ncbi:hypothetical protein BRD56_08390 [Thermoplasmatales archaeon SW_10_69_26]|nr:MAG: hypothetical protein BRD56_08390 [Thermoplasmatales archaeon SW_10_69_26]
MTGEADCRRSKACTAASGTGNATASRLALTGTGDATGRTPISASGECREHATEAYRDCLALETGEDAHGHHAGASVTGDASGCIAASATGEAESGCHELFEVGDAECTPHPPIRITERVGERGFEWVNPATGEREIRPGSGVVRGSGTAGDPYVIEGWCIQAPPAVSTPEGPTAGIVIQGTEAHVQIRESFVYGVPHTEHQVYGVPVDQFTRGIVLDGVGNATVQNTTIAYHGQGLVVDSASQTHLQANTAHSNTGNGFFITHSTETLIKNNTATNNGASGIYANEGDGGEILSNTVTLNRREGIRIEADAAIRNNLAHDNFVGIVSTSEQETPIASNTAIDNDVAGIVIGSRNHAFENTMRDNGIAGIAAVFGSSDNTIEDNLVAGEHEVGFLLGTDTAGNLLSQNNITGNENGVWAEEAESLAMHENNVWNNSATGLNVVSIDEPVNATHNWWGCPDGPSAQACDGVAGEAIVDPWLREPVAAAGLR